MEDPKNAGQHEQQVESKTQASGISQQKLEANQRNAKLSTGPKSDEGKAKSRFNAIKHGCTSKIIFAADGKPRDPDLVALAEALEARYGTDVHCQLLIDVLLSDAFRHRHALKRESEMFAGDAKYTFHPQSSMPVLDRYATSARRSIQKTIAALEEIRANDQDREGSEIVPGDEPEAAIDDAGVGTDDTERDEEQAPESATTHDPKAPLNVSPQVAIEQPTAADEDPEEPGERGHRGSESAE